MGNSETGVCVLQLATCEVTVGRHISRAELGTHQAAGTHLEAAPLSITADPEDEGKTGALQ